MTTDIHACARCGKDHPDIELIPLANHDRYTHYATCPNTGQPIMVAVRDVDTQRPVRD